MKSLNFFAEPINQPFLLSNFLKFNLVDIALDLTFIKEGDYNPSGCSATPPAAGQQCTPIIPQLVAPTNPNGLSPLDFLNLSANNSSVSFSVKGTARRISTGETSAVTGAFTETFISPSNTTDGSFQTTLTAFNTAGSFTADYTATFIATPATVPTPEPASMALVGIGLSGLALLTRRGAMHVPDIRSPDPRFSSQSVPRISVYFFSNEALAGNSLAPPRSRMVTVSGEDACDRPTEMGLFFPASGPRPDTRGQTANSRALSPQVRFIQRIESTAYNGTELALSPHRGTDGS